MGLFRTILYSIDEAACVICQVDVNTEVGVVRDIRLKELRLYTDYGRCSRPLFIVEKQRLLIKKQDVRALQMKVRSKVFNECTWRFVSNYSEYCWVSPILDISFYLFLFNII